MSRRISLALLLPVTVCLAAACSSSTNGTGGTGGGGGSSTASAPAATPQALGAAMHKAVQSVTSARVGLSGQLAGQSLTGSGVEKLSNGKLTAMDFTEKVGAIGTIEIRIVGNKNYAKLPAAMNPSKKPWVLVSKNSSSMAVRAMAGSLNSSLSAASLNQFDQFAKVASSVKKVGTATVDGQPATHYSLTVDVSKLPMTGSNAAAMKAAGVSKVPVELYLDSQNRPVKVVESFAVQGQHVGVTVTVHDYNAPVTITAPPASQVFTG